MHADVVFVRGNNPEHGLLEKSERARAAVPGFLDRMVKMRFVFEENDHYLSLALPDGGYRDPTERHVSGMSEEELPAATRPFPAIVSEGGGKEQRTPSPPEGGESRGEGVIVEVSSLRGGDPFV